MKHRPTQNLAALIGNGVSIAFNPDLNLREIGQEVIRRIRAANSDGTAVEALMQKIAARDQTGDAREDFEVLVGSFAGHVETFDQLSQLAELLGAADHSTREALILSANVAQGFYDTGLSHVLKVISERAVAEYDRKTDLTEFIRALVEDVPGPVTIGNLNYDTLLLAGLMEFPGAAFCDLADGRFYAEIVAPDGTRIPGQPLRSRLDCPNRIKLYQLHGSLTFWRRPDGVIVKIAASDARRADLYTAIRDDPSFQSRPVVVLANQRDKADHVAKYPFSLAYEGFTAGLDESDHWLIVGYSFRDECVNQKIREAFRRRNAVGSTPTVLLVTYGAELTTSAVTDAFGWDNDEDGSADWLTVNRDGANAMSASADWHRFIGGGSGLSAIAV